ncbi:unnamed protein product [Trifolium pratense]|uniref:Uncharacterized protein n=1 Tax=Trifolium pratense TaxID=57577 RepID=A0ACB0K6Y3_TRIPR|nr:unnamed protein product [Trifolium pratense]
MKNLAIPLPTSTDSFKIRFSHLILQHVPQSHRSITVRGIMLCLRALSASRDLLCFVFPGSKEISRKLFFGTGEGAKGGVKIKSIRFQNSGSGYKI